jgi:hypothetical protein
MSKIACRYGRIVSDSSQNDDEDEWDSERLWIEIDRVSVDRSQKRDPQSNINRIQ